MTNTIIGTEEDDILQGTSGRDRIFGADGNDTLYGKGDNDTLEGNFGSDVLFGGSGNDVGLLNYDDDTFFGGVGEDSATAFSEAGYDVYGGEGNDSLRAFTGSSGTYDGGDGFDHLSLFGLRHGGTFSITEGGGEHRLNNVESVLMSLLDGANGGTLLGSDGDDSRLHVYTSGNATAPVRFSIKAGGGNDFATAGEARAKLYGEGGNDVLRATDGMNTLFGGVGTDTLITGFGRDTSYGGENNDSISFVRTIALADGGAGNDRFTLNPTDENSFGDPLNAYANGTINGGDGHDTIGFNITTAEPVNLVVNYEESTLTLSSAAFESFTLSFCSIEEFVLAEDKGSITYVGEQIEAPVISKDDPNRSAEKTISKILKNGDEITFRDSIGAGDLFDVLAINVQSIGTLTVTAYVQGLSGGPCHVENNSYVINVEGGRNTIYIEQPTQGYDQRTEYLLQIEYSVPSTFENRVKIDNWIKLGNLDLIKLASIDGPEFSASMAALFNEAVQSVDDAVYFLNAAAERIGQVGKIFDVANKSFTISNAFATGGFTAGLRSLYVEVVDFLTGFAATGVGAFAGGFLGPFGAGIAGFTTALVYSNDVSARVKIAAGEDFDVLFNNVPPNGGSGNQMPLDISGLLFDAQWYGQTYPDALTAVEDGAYSSLFAYFLDVGLEAGHPPNANASSIDTADLAIDLEEYRAGLQTHSAIFNIAAGEMAADDLSLAEEAMATQIQNLRSTAINVDAGLSVVANRVARDWILNQTENVDVASFANGPSRWVDTLSTGQTFADALRNLPGLTVGLDSGLKIMGLYSSAAKVSNVLAQFLERASASDAILDLNSNSIGIAEFAGLWVIIVDTDVNADDAVVGDPYHDVIFTATEGDDLIYAGYGKADVKLIEGDDIFRGGRQGDTVFGGTGEDVLLGFRGGDTLNGDEGNDHIETSQGTDLAYGGGGEDYITGGASEDTLYGGGQSDDMFGGSGADVLYADGGNDTAAANAGTDEIYGGGGNDILRGAGGDDTLFGGSGSDTLLGAANKDLLFGDGGNDDLDGAQAQDTLYGGTGNDALKGGSGDDTLSGDGGDDVLRGGKGNDLFFGGSGNDEMIGSDGNDDFVFANGFGDDIITDFDALSGAEDIDLSAVSAITSYLDLSSNHMAQSGADVVISDGANSITLKNISLSNLDATDFLF